MRWTQTRRFPNRICWTLQLDPHAYRLRATEIGEGRALLEMYRTDKRSELSERRDGWKEEVLLPDGNLDNVKNLALTWAALRIR